MPNSEIPSWKKARCVRCEEGAPLCSDGRTHKTKFDCTATEAEYIAELETKLVMEGLNCRRYVDWSAELTAERNQLRDALAVATKSLARADRFLCRTNSNGFGKCDACGCWSNHSASSVEHNPDCLVMELRHALSAPAIAAERERREALELQLKVLHRDYEEAFTALAAYGFKDQTNPSDDPYHGMITAFGLIHAMGRKYKKLEAVVEAVRKALEAEQKRCSYCNGTGIFTAQLPHHRTIDEPCGECRWISDALDDTVAREGK